VADWQPTPLWRALRRGGPLTGLLLLLLLAASPPTQAETLRRYDAQGRYLGRVERSGRETGAARSYDAQGRFTGRAERRGGQIRRYDAQGRFLGRDEVPPRRRLP
jgi:YD repeat-containing protein